MNRSVARGLRPARRSVSKHESSLASTAEVTAGRVVSGEGVYVCLRVCVLYIEGRLHRKAALPAIPDCGATGRYYTTTGQTVQLLLVESSVQKVVCLALYEQLACEREQCIGGAVVFELWSS